MLPKVMAQAVGRHGRGWLVRAASAASARGVAGAPPRVACLGARGDPTRGSWAPQMRAAAAGGAWARGLASTVTTVEPRTGGGGDSGGGGGGCGKCGGGGGGNPADELAREISQLTRVAAEERPPERVAALVEAAAAHLAAFTPEHASIVLLALSQLQHHPGDAFLEAVCLEVLKAKAAEFGGRDMMTSLWALQRLGYRPSPAVLSALCRPMETTLADYNSQEVVTVLWCLNKLDHRPGEMILSSFASEVESRLGELSAKDLGTALWGLATQSYIPRASFLMRMEMEVMEKLDEFSAQSLAGALHAMSEFRYEPGDETLLALEAAVVKLMDSFSQSEMSISVNALVRMGHEPATLLGALRQRLEAKEACVEGYATASPQELLLSLQAVVQSGERPDPTDFSILLYHMQENLGGLDSKSLASALMAIAETSDPMGTGLDMGRVHNVALAKLPEFDALDMYHMMLSVATMSSKSHQPPTAAFMDSLTAQLASHLPIYPPADLVTAVSAYSLMVKSAQYVPSEQIVGQIGRLMEENAAALAADPAAGAEIYRAHKFLNMMRQVEFQEELKALVEAEQRKFEAERIKDATSSRSPSKSAKQMSYSAETERGLAEESNARRR